MSSRNFFFAGLLLWSLVDPLDANAAEPSRPWGPTLEVGGLYGIPFGKFSAHPDDLYLLDIYTGVPGVSAGLGWHFNQHFYVGAYGQLGFPDLQGHCPPDECIASQQRLGITGRYRFKTFGQWKPWIGGGGGYEAARLTLRYQRSNGGWTSESLRFLGWDLHVEAGVERGITDWLTFSPFLHVAGGPYFDIGGYVVQQPGPHFWGFFGFRFQLRPFKEAQNAGG